MATNLTHTLTLSAGTDTVSDSLAFTGTDTLSVEPPIVSMARVDVLHTGAGTEIIAAGTHPHTYFYAKNIDATNYVICRNAAGNEWGRLAPGEFMFMAVAEDQGIEFLAVTATCEVEYGYWTKA